MALEPSFFGSGRERGASIVFSGAAESESCVGCEQQSRTELCRCYPLPLCTTFHHHHLSLSRRVAENPFRVRSSVHDPDVLVWLLCVRRSPRREKVFQCRVCFERTSRWVVVESAMHHRHC